ncbi:hypothetical protein [Microbacterium sp. 13-71-7]|jgi:hypothetical protein|uniref:hypothetical protein n=1 Tax=Microbacterium sp. 13-71-7 TaxID=1970399 RepID=UPI000BC764BF|nr:hypothetical protein [Microbacterium sp. 13-71-7]OZB85398.1 MAG: hypothetical protein B7X32_03655 [Microbacterium sp. 13-71-7]
MDEQLSDEAPYQPTYVIPASARSIAEQRITRANRRLRKLGIDEQFVMLALKEFIAEPDPDHPYRRSMLRFQLNAPSIAHAGWRFAGAHQATPDGHIVSYGSAAPATSMRCEHCGQNRRRGTVYTVVNGDNTIQVGSTCLEAFLGVKPDGLWALMFDAVGELDDDETYRSFSDPNLVARAVDVIYTALEVSDEGRKFVSRQHGSVETPATAALVSEALGRISHGLGDSADPERLERARQILAWVTEQPAEVSNYVDNLRAVLAGADRYVGRKHVGIAVSAVSAYHREQAKASAKAEVVPGFIGEVGERLRDLPVTVNRMTYLGLSEYGYPAPEKWFLSFRDEDGKTAVWFTTGEWGDRFDEGNTVLLTATVKAQEEYAGSPQTVLTRAKVTLVEPAPSE